MLFTPIFFGAAATLACHATAEVDPVLKRNAEAQIPQNQRPIQGVRKMSDDEGQKFFMNYWDFGEEMVVGNSTEGLENREYTQIDRSIRPRSYPFQPSISDGRDRFSAIRFSPFARRDFQCPVGTVGCTSIGRPDSCCHTDETCMIVEDTGSGDVGCCPAGQDCSGTIGSCWGGYTSCPSSLGGGCCFPGYECVSEGCAHVVTVTVTMHSTVVTTTSIETIPPNSSPSGSTGGSDTTTSETTTTSDTSSTSSATETVPSSTLLPPTRPTSLPTVTTSSTELSCPTGFYACAAVYQGGCCRTGRDCDTTSCPVVSSTTVVSGNPTVVIPVTTSKEGGSGQCATGWFSCADTVGGGCCPTGYACGSSCTAVATASTTGTLDKEAPSNRGRGRLVEGVWGLLGWSAILMIWMMI